MASVELPKNIDAERALIGSCLQSGKIEDKAELVTPKDFLDQQNKAIWEAMCRLHGRGDPIDIISVSAALKGSEYVGEVEAAALMTKMISEVPSSMHVEKYAELVLVTAAKRKLALAIPDISRIAYGDGTYDPFTVFADAQAIVEEAGRDIQPFEREQWSAAEIAGFEIPPDPFFLEGLLIRGGLNLLAGEYAAGKTFLCLDLAIGSSSGAISWGRSVIPGRCFYFGSDNRRETLTRRVRELCAGRGINPPHESLTFDISPPDIGTPAGMATIKNMVKKHDADLVIIDALSRYMGSIDENSAQDVGSMMGELREITRVTDCTILMVHHLRKIGQQMTKSKIADRVRGSGDFIGAVDSVVVLTTKGEGPNIIRNVAHIKNREDIESHPLSFSIQPGEKAGLVLPFEAGSDSMAADTLAETAATIMANALQRDPGVFYLKADLLNTIAGTGINLGERTGYKAFKMLASMPTIVVAKQGRFNVYTWKS